MSGVHHIHRIFSEHSSGQVGRPGIIAARSWHPSGWTRSAPSCAAPRRCTGRAAAGARGIGRRDLRPVRDGDRCRRTGLGHRGVRHLPARRDRRAAPVLCFRLARQDARDAVMMRCRGPGRPAAAAIAPPMPLHQRHPAVPPRHGRPVPRTGILRFLSRHAASSMDLVCVRREKSHAACAQTHGRRRVDA